MSISELKNTLSSLLNNLENDIVRHQINNKDPKFNFDLLLRSIKGYLEQPDTFIKSKGEVHIQEITKQAKSLLGLTYDEHVGIHAVKFTQYGNFLIKNSPISEINSSEDNTNLRKQLEEEIKLYQSTISQYHVWAKNQNIQLSSADKTYIQKIINEYEKLKPEIEKIQREVNNSSEYSKNLQKIHNLRTEQEKYIQDIEKKLINNSSHHDSEVPENTTIKFGSSKLSGSATLSINAQASNSGVKKKNLQLDSHELNIIKKEEVSPALGVNKIASVLSSIIEKQPIDSGMMIGIFGKWGRGKTYLFNRILKYINKNSAGKNYKIVQFSAWKYQEKNASWGYLYERFMESYLDDTVDSECFKWCQKAWKLLKLNIARIGLVPIGIFIGSFVLSLVWLFIIDKIVLMKYILSFMSIIVFIKLFIMYISYKNPAIKLFKKYFFQNNFTHILGFQAEVQKELVILIKQWISDKDIENKKIILFVDDLDRCHPEQIINVLDGLRIILDEEALYSRLIIVTAIDEEILKYAIEAKYENFYREKEAEKEKHIFKEYIEKVFLVGIKLNNLTRKESTQMLDKIITASTTGINKETDKDKVSVNSDGISTTNDNINIDVNNDDMLQFVQAIEIDNEDEKRYLLYRVSDLHKNTPRKIRIFYYKYLIFKKLLYLRFKELDMLEEWDKINYKHVIIDMLIDASNGKLERSYTEISYTDAEGSMYDEIKYVIEMISVL